MARSPAPADDMDPFVWLRTRPPVVRELMLRLPPVCRVRAIPDERLQCPAPGRVGRVVSYNEAGEVTVVHEDDWMAEREGALFARCAPEWLEVVGYDGNKTPEWVARVLAGEDIPAVNPGQDGRIEGSTP